jgi:hypothetical protein
VKVESNHPGCDTYIFIRCLGRGLSAWLRNGYWKKIWRTGKKPKEAMSAAIETTGDQK